jgi:hypothetical protein
MTQVTADRYGRMFPSLEALLTDRLDRTYLAALTENGGGRVRHARGDALS